MKELKDLVVGDDVLVKSFLKNEFIYVKNP